MNAFLKSFLVNGKENKLYGFLIALRIILTVIPQRGYIHPDEFFQSIEVMAGDVFDVESNRPWELNATFPVRSVFIPYILVRFPYKIVEILNAQFEFYLSVTLKSPYWLVVVPRVLVCFMSFLIDYCLYKVLRRECERNYKKKLIVLASSYVVLVYGTRTFSNSVEMVLLAVLLYFVSDSQMHTNAVLAQYDYVSAKYHRAASAVDRANLLKRKHWFMNQFQLSTTRNCIVVSFITVAGVFNRPTFVAYALVPIFFWLHRGSGFRFVCFLHFHVRMLLYLFSTAFFSCLFILADSFYFGYLAMADILHNDVSINNFVVTPFNFIKYNMNTNNLAQHGLHPRFTHLLINIPLLYNILGIIGIGGIALLFYRLITGQLTKLPCVSNMRCMMIMTIVCPVIFLSYFPHQEPRFLIPITLPLVYLYGDRLLNKRICIQIWCFMNIVLVLFYGFIHQAGIYPLTSHYNVLLHSRAHTTTHLVTSHIYDIPVSLIMLPNARKIYGTGSAKYVLRKSLVLHEMGSESFTTVLNRFQAVRRTYVHARKHTHTMTTNQKQLNLYFVLPTSKLTEFMSFMNTSFNHFTLNHVQTFYPHISIEALPIMFPLVHITDYYSFNFHSILNFFEQCGLGLYEVYESNCYLK